MTPASPRRIVLILPCCIGDVVLATATLKALRRGYPNSQMTWAVGSWSKAALEHHDLLDAVLDTGADALPVRSISGFIHFVRQLRAGKFDLAVSLARSPLMSLAVLLSGIPTRVGLDSAGRGFGYNIRARIDPYQARHEADIYLDGVRALGLDTTDCWANVPVRDADIKAVRQILSPQAIAAPYIVINPAGGRNPGMTMDIKRWPPPQMAELARRLAPHYGAQIVVIGGPQDTGLVDAVQALLLPMPSASFPGVFTFPQLGALAREALVYIGNDTGVTHYAAAAGAKTVMILGPSDPVRYAPFTPNSLALWKPASLPSGGVASGAPLDWDWARDGISVDDAESKIIQFLNAKPLSHSNLNDQTP
jgi:ADP-heptose:LPS heptosyltransferase